MNLTYYLLFIYLFVYLTNGYNTPMDPTQYDQALEIAHLFNLNMSEYSIIDGKYTLCGNFDSTFDCYNQRVTRINLFGNGSTSITKSHLTTLMPSLLAIEFISVPINEETFTSFFDSTVSNLKYLELDTCNVTSFPIDTFTYIGFNQLKLFNNPIECNVPIDIMKFKNLTLWQIFTKNSLYIKNFTYTDFIPFGKFASTVNLITNNFPNSNLSMYEMQFIMGPNFNLSSYDNVLQYKTSNLGIFDLLGLYSLPEFPAVNKNNVGVIQLQVNIEPQSTFINLTEYESLNSLLITTRDIPLSLNKQFPFVGCAGRLTYLLLQNSDFPNFPADILGCTSISHLLLINSGIGGTLPDISKSKLQLIDLSYNKFTGSVDKMYCNILVNLSYNNLTGNLPGCIGCYLRNPDFARNFRGNNFTNYKEGEIYPPCTITITKSILSINKISVYGTNLPPRSMNEVISIPAFTLPPQPFNSTYFSMLLNRKSIYDQLKAQGYIDFHFITQNVTIRAPLTIAPPEMTNIIYSPLLNIGYTFSAFGFNLGTNYSEVKVEIPPYKAYITKLTDYNVICDLYNTSIPEKQYTFIYNYSGIVVRKDFNFVRSYPILTAATPAPLAGGNITLFGYFGPNPYNFTVNIVSQSLAINISCNNAVGNSTTIICEIEPVNIENINNYFFLLYYNVDGILGMGSYGYFDTNSLTCSVDGCGNHGACTTLGCMCYQGFRGAKCDLIADNPNIVVNSTGAHFGDDDGSFTLSIVSVRELTPFGVLVSEIPIDKWTPTAINNNNGEVHSIFEFKKNNFTITTDFEEIISEKNITFAGIEMNLQPGSIKLSITLSSWQYISSVNYLQVVLNSTADFNQCDEDGSGDNGIETDGNLNFLQIKKGGKVFYGQFLNKVLSDQRATIVSNQVLSEDDNSILIGLNLPHCNECVIDPNFSVLLDSDFNDEKCNSSSLKDKTWILPVAVVIPIVSVAILISAAYVLVKKKQHIKFQKKLERLKNKSFVK
ncbi:tenascin C [Tieghemostelium lacteum]|uniref:Tenascin C n=1 Tax=Tieghemostelium lacteum TaxID=361077 RepID=A0A151Z5Y5_TIELA|nr:tenascin C [Tieghemostelium lacteum]|eukprot:KYQ89348.1 tenascin C [Tieghemostelium lacteum]